MLWLSGMVKWGRTDLVWLKVALLLLRLSDLVQWNSDITLPGYNAFPPITIFSLGPMGKGDKSNVCLPGYSAPRI